MPLHYAKSHHGNAAEYQVSGIPFVTSSAVTEVTSPASAIQVRFPYVTQWFEVSSIGYGGLKVGFSENGVLSNPNANYFIVSSGSLSTKASTTSISATSVRFDVRCKEIWISGLSSNDPAKDAGFTVMAALTNVKSRDFPTLTGSDGFEGVG